MIIRIVVDFPLRWVRATEDLPGRDLERDAVDGPEAVEFLDDIAQGDGGVHVKSLLLLPAIIRNPARRVLKPLLDPAGTPRYLEPHHDDRLQHRCRLRGPGLPRADRGQGAGNPVVESLVYTGGEIITSRKRPTGTLGSPDYSDASSPGGWNRSTS
jgi:hypothetical protein